MSNDSTISGYLAPVGSPLINEVELRRLLQEWLVGVVGIAGELVRPRWQENPPALPAYGTDWIAFGYTTRPADTFAAVIHDGAAEVVEGQALGVDKVYRQQLMEVLVSFYGPNADELAVTLKQGAQIEQNRWALRDSAACSLVGIGDEIKAAEKVKELWWNRVDVTVTLRRALLSTYGVRNLKSVEQEIVVDE